MKKLMTLCMVMLFMLVVTGTAMGALVSYWSFEEGVGVVGYDSIGTNDGTVEGASWTTDGAIGGALEYDQSQPDRVVVPDDDSLEPPKVSVAAWVKSNGTPGSYKYIVAKYYQGGYASYGLYTGGSGGLYFYVSNGSFALSPYLAGTEVWNGEWHHVVGTYDGAFLRLYVDGSEVGSGVSCTKTIGYNDGDLYIGSYGAGYYFDHDGGIDEVAIWSHALSAEEVMNVCRYGALATNVVTLRFNANNIFNYATSDDTRLNQQGTARRLWDCPTGRYYLTYNDADRDVGATAAQDLQSVANILGWDGAWEGYQGVSHIQLWLKGGASHWGERILVKDGTTLTVSTGNEFGWTAYTGSDQLVHYNTELLTTPETQNAISPDFNPAKNLWSVTGDFYVDENQNGLYDDGEGLEIGNKYTIWFNAAVNNWRCFDDYGNNFWGNPDIEGTIMATAVDRVADILVNIDIKPGSEVGDDNTISMETQGLIPVAIFSTESFDATTVDADTLELAGAEAGVRMQGKGNEYMAQETDVNGDGLIDLIVHMATANLAEGVLQEGYAVLTGSTTDDKNFEGWDYITIVPE